MAQNEEKVQGRRVDAQLMARDLPRPGAMPAGLGPRVLLEFKVLWGSLLSLSQPSCPSLDVTTFSGSPHQHGSGWLAEERVENETGRAVVLLVRGRWCWGAAAAVHSPPLVKARPENSSV